MIELLQVLEYVYMIVKHTVSKLMYTKNMYQHKMTQECILPQTSNFSQIRVGKEEQEQEQVVRRRSTARVRTYRQTDSVLSVLLGTGSQWARYHCYQR